MRRAAAGPVAGRTEGDVGRGAGNDRWSLGVLLLATVMCAACGGHGGSGPSTPPTTGGSRQFRAIAGVSMGAYGAMNLGTKHADQFGTIAALGGPVDMRQLLRDMVNDNLEVKSADGHSARCRRRASPSITKRPIPDAIRGCR